jgi:hypothetical protein
VSGAVTSTEETTPPGANIIAGIAFALGLVSVGLAWILGNRTLESFRELGIQPPLVTIWFTSPIWHLAGIIVLITATMAMRARGCFAIGMASWMAGYLLYISLFGLGLYLPWRKVSAELHSQGVESAAP